MEWNIIKDLISEEVIQERIQDWETFFTRIENSSSTDIGIPVTVLGTNYMDKYYSNKPESSVSIQSKHNNKETSIGRIRTRFKNVRNRKVNKRKKLTRKWRLLYRKVNSNHRRSDEDSNIIFNSKNSDEVINVDDSNKTNTCDNNEIHTASQSNLNSNSLINTNEKLFKKYKCKQLKVVIEKSKYSKPDLDEVENTKKSNDLHLPEKIGTDLNKQVKQKKINSLPNYMSKTDDNTSINFTNNHENTETQNVYSINKRKKSIDTFDQTIKKRKTTTLKNILSQSVTLNTKQTQYFYSDNVNSKECEHNEKVILLSIEDFL